jgi:hypothetical protein
MMTFYTPSLISVFIKKLNLGLLYETKVGDPKPRELNLREKNVYHRRIYPTHFNLQKNKF